MRVLALSTIALVACSACSASSSGGSPAASSDAEAVPTCLHGMLVLDGASNSVPHGAYAMTNVVITSSDFSATLPAGGSLELSWTGDATAGPVTVTGKMYLPSEDEGPPSGWCVYAPSTLQVSGNSGALELSMEPPTVNACDGPAGMVALAATGCIDFAS
jgi:hypothetical protein